MHMNELQIRQLGIDSFDCARMIADYVLSPKKGQSARQEIIEIGSDY